jgi:predicted dinucleotide-utilizing enzyme
MRLNVEFGASVARTDLDDYIRNLEVTVTCYDEDALHEYVVGKLAMDQVLWMDALTDGVSLFEICDNDSQGLHEVHTILTKGKQDFRSDLKIDEVTNHVMFLYGAVFHQAIHAYRQGILDAAFTLFGEESVAVMWKDTSGLSETEMADLGFCKIAASELIFRHSALLTPFSDANPNGQDADDAVARPEYEEWVMQEWKKFQGIIP